MSENVAVSSVEAVEKSFLKWSKEFQAAFHDILRLLVIQIVTQFLLYCSNDSKYRFFDSSFLQSLIYLVLGIGVYWFVVRKLLLTLEFFDEVKVSEISPEFI